MTDKPNQMWAVDCQAISELLEALNVASRKLHASGLLIGNWSGILFPITSESAPGFLGYVCYGEDGETLVFQPSNKDDYDKAVSEK